VLVSGYGELTGTDPKMVKRRERKYDEGSISAKPVKKRLVPMFHTTFSLSFSL
jgi:hypothetical protein